MWHNSFHFYVFLWRLCGWTAKRLMCVPFLRFFRHSIYKLSRLLSYYLPSLQYYIVLCCFHVQTRNFNAISIPLDLCGRLLVLFHILFFSLFFISAPELSKCREWCVCWLFIVFHFDDETSFFFSSKKIVSDFPIFFLIQLRVW